MVYAQTRVCQQIPSVVSDQHLKEIGARKEGSAWLSLGCFQRLEVCWIYLVIGESHSLSRAAHVHPFNMVIAISLKGRRPSHQPPSETQYLLVLRSQASARKAQHASEYRSTGHSQ
jgi:hypothetical protein